jgi:hypothetical protein
MLVKMQHVDTGHVADVHPDMVDHYTAGGYRRAEKSMDDVTRIPTKSEIARMPKADVIGWLEAHGADYPADTPVSELRGALRAMMFADL